LKKHLARLFVVLSSFTAVVSSLSVPFAAAQSPEVNAERALFNQILIIGIVVGMVVFGLMFYAIVRYRERPQKGQAN
jgi:heme/copper-type cytochrome/quinol oxidase subunit 2